MTQELVIGVLLTGLVGLIWAMTVSLLRTDPPVSRANGTEMASGSSDAQADRHHTIAA